MQSNIISLITLKKNLLNQYYHPLNSFNYTNYIQNLNTITKTSLLKYLIRNGKRPLLAFLIKKQQAFLKSAMNISNTMTKKYKKSLSYLLTNAFNSKK